MPMWLCAARAANTAICGSTPSRCTSSSATACGGGVRSEAWIGTYGAVPGCPPEFAAGAKLNVVWGNNATVTNLHLVRRIRQSKRAGGRLIVIDPLRTKIAEQADLHLAPLPGTDVLLAWALAAELERLGAFDHAFIAQHMLGFDEFMADARAWPVARAATACGLRAEDIETLLKKAEAPAPKDGKR